VSESDRPIDVFLASLLGAPPEENAQAREEFASVPPEELDRVRRAVEAMAQSAGATQTPDEVLRTVRGLLSRPRRLDGYTASLARFFDIDEAEARALLSRIDVPEEWMEGPDVGISVLPVAAGPRAQTALASLVRLPPGITLSQHEHVGREELFVLEGGFADSVGHVVWPGETLDMPTGSSHAMWGLPGPSCVCAALLWMDGQDSDG
jgi:quercetin dioxygenase-like cupin family protein